MQCRLSILCRLWFLVWVSQLRLSSLWLNSQWDVVQVPGLDLGSMALLASDAELFSPVASLLDSRHSQQAIEVRCAAARASYCAGSFACCTSFP